MNKLGNKIPKHELSNPLFCPVPPANVVFIFVQYIGTSPTAVKTKNSFRALSLCSRFVRCRMVRLYSLQSEPDVRRQYLTSNYYGTASITGCVDDRGTSHY